MVQKLTESQVRDWLQGCGIKNVQAVIDGIDLNQPVYLDWLHPGQKLVQYRDRPSLAYPLGAQGGQWFALYSHPGDMGTLGIGSGLAGRTRYVLTVKRGVQVLESTAKR